MDLCKFQAAWFCKASSRTTRAVTWKKRVEKGRGEEQGRGGERKKREKGRKREERRERREKKEGRGAKEIEVFLETSMSKTPNESGVLRISTSPLTQYVQGSKRTPQFTCHLKIPAHVSRRSWLKVIYQCKSQRY